MKDLDKNLKALKYDQRMVDWNLSQDLLSKQELETYLKSLPDSIQNSEKLTLEDEGEYSNGRDH